MENFRRHKITEIVEIKYKITGEPYYTYREVNVVRGWARFGHYILDYLVLQGVSYLINLAFAFKNPDMYSMQPNELIALQLKLIALALLYNFIYYAGFEGFFGSTPGKMLLGRVVIDEHGERPDFPRILLRTICRWVPFEAISCLWPRGWHDQWSKTFVVNKDEADKLFDAITKMEVEETQRNAEQYRAQQGPQI